MGQSLHVSWLVVLAKNPTGQSAQISWPFFFSTNFPCWQSLHVVLALPELRPSAHFSHCDFRSFSFEKWFSGQNLHFVEPAWSEYSPGMHGKLQIRGKHREKKIKYCEWKEKTVSATFVPGIYIYSSITHHEACDSWFWYRPLSHAVHSDKSGVGVNLPSLHGEHLPLSMYKPGAHVEHATLPLPDLRPSAQLSHGVCLSFTVENVFSAQGLHAVAPVWSMYSP